MLEMFLDFCNITVLFQLHQLSNNIHMVVKMMDLDHLAVPSVRLTKPSDGSQLSYLLTAVEYCSFISSIAFKTQIIQQVLLFF